MRRTISLIFTLMVLTSFLAHYPLIASAPSHAATITPDLFSPAKRVRELGRSNWYQSFLAEPATPLKKAPVADKVSDSPGVPEPTSVLTGAHESGIDSRSFVQITAPHDADLTFLSSDKRPAQDGNYCDASFVGEPMTFSQSVGSTLDELLNQIHNR